MIIIPRVTLLWNNRRLTPGKPVELLDADAEHLISEGVADEQFAEGTDDEAPVEIVEPATPPAVEAAGKK